MSIGDRHIESASQADPARHPVKRARPRKLKHSSTIVLERLCRQFVRLQSPRVRIVNNQCIMGFTSYIEFLDWDTCLWKVSVKLPCRRSIADMCRSSTSGPKNIAHQHTCLSKFNTANFLLTCAAMSIESSGTDIINRSAHSVNTTSGLYSLTSPQSMLADHTKVK